MSNTNIVLAAIRGWQGLTDSEIVRRTGITPHQQVNQICRRLAREGCILREAGPNGVLVNRAPPPSVNGHTADHGLGSSPNIQARQLQAPSATRASLTDLEHLDLRENEAAKHAQIPAHSSWTNCRRPWPPSCKRLATTYDNVS